MCLMFPRSRVLAVVTLLGLISACSTVHYPINPPLSAIDSSSGYRPAKVFASDLSDNFFLSISFSGGGTRAAALGFGVLEALRDTAIKWEGKDQRLLDQIDWIAGVSGGSMLAAAYALDGADGMDNFETNFLMAPIQGELIRRMASPFTLWRLGSPRFGRSDVLAELLDEKLYHGATFGDLGRRQKKPFMVLSATDMSTGARFDFTQDQFDFLCSDVGGVSISRAVAASSAVPLILSPITLWNYSPPSDSAEAKCGEPTIEATQLKAESPNPRIAELRSFRETQDGVLMRPYVHLLDGGLADNVNVRGPLDFTTISGGLLRSVRNTGYRAVRRSVFIVVNAETSVQSKQDTDADVPSPMRSALALGDIPINRNSDFALSQARAAMKVWEAEVSDAHSKGDYSIFAKDIKFFFIEVTLTAEPDRAARKRLMSIPTTLQLQKGDVQLLKEYGAKALRNSQGFKQLLESLGATSNLSAQRVP
jgi:NTE family protein